MDSEVDCKCTKIIGNLEDVKWLLWPRNVKPSTGAMALADWTTNPHIWLHYVESADGILTIDDVLMSTDSRYWSIHDPQRYFTGDLHCEQVLFTYQYPNVRMPTRLGSHFWKSNTALKLTPALYQKMFSISLDITLKKLEAKQAQMDRLIVCDQLIKLERLDYFRRKTFFKLLENILSFQDQLQLVSFENLCCKRLEGVRLIQQLACFNADTLKYLFLWRFVLPNENPILVNYSYLTGTVFGGEIVAMLTGQGKGGGVVIAVKRSGAFVPRPDTKQCFLRSLGELRNLRVLALEYSHIADSTGGALITLMPAIKRPHFKLQIICREDQVPGCTDAALGVGGHHIPDTAWRKVMVACPDLLLFMAFHRIRDYDNVRRFLTPSIPLREIHLEYGIDIKMRQRQDSDLNSIVRHIAFRYANTLAVLSIHQWRYTTFPLRRVFELMPHIRRFFYVGSVEDEVDLQRMLQIIACGVCDNLKQIRIQIQDQTSKRDYWQKVVDNLTSEYSDILNLYDINFCFNVYKS